MRCLLFSLFFFVISVSFPAHAFNEFHSEQDSVVYSDKFWADVVFKGQNTGVTRFRIIYEAPMAMVFAQLIDTASLHKYHDNYADSRSLSLENLQKILTGQPADPAALVKIIGDARLTGLENRKAGGKWTDYWYMRFNLPWPLNDKWVVQTAKVDESQAGKNYYRVDYDLNLGNVKTAKGWWELVEVPGKPGWTEFRGETESDPGIPVPEFLARSTFKSSLKKEFETNTAIFKKRLTQQK